ncbi:MAG: DNA-binding protein [Nitrososphaerota archaeon]
MRITDLRDGMGKVTVRGTITRQIGIRDVTLRSGEPAKVGEFELEDESGKITLVLWNEDIDRVSPGDEVVIENGYVRTFKGELQLSVGKWGTLRLIRESEKAP